MLITKVLSEIGFSQKESAVYMALVTLDTATPAEVSDKSKINRTSCYDILRGLMHKGLVTKFVKRGKQYFHAGDPRSLLAYLEHEKREAANTIEKQAQLVRDVLPELSSLLRPKSTKPRVEFFEGEKGMREAYEDTLTADGVYYAYANFETMHAGLPGFFPDYYKRRVQAKIRGQGIFPKNKTNIEQFKNNKQKLRESAMLPNAQDQFTPEVIIYDDKLLIVSWKEKVAVRIESAELAHLHRVLFKQLWTYMQKDPGTKIT